MSDHDDHSTPVGEWPSIVQVGLASLMGGLLVVLLGTPAPDGFGRAVATVGLVSVEAVVLYVGYGALTRIAGPAARKIFVSD